MSDAQNKGVPSWQAWMDSSDRIVVPFSRMPSGALAPESGAHDPAARVSFIRSMLLQSARYLHQEYLLMGAHQQASGIAPILALVERFGPLTPTLLAHYGQVQRPSVTRILARLVQDGLIEARCSEDDARSHKVSVTEVGREALREARLRDMAFLSHFMAQLSQGQIATLRQAAVLLTRFVDIRSKAMLGSERFEVIAYLRLMLALFARHVRNHTPLDLGSTCGGILAQLQRFGSSLPSELARRECISRATMTQLQNQLHDMGLIDVRRDDLDARSTLISISDAGLDYLSRLSAQHDARIFSLLQAVPPGREKVLHEACVILRQALVRVDPDAVSD